MAVTRLASVDDAEELAAVVAANRAFLAPWEPLRDEAFFTVAGQREQLERALDGYAREANVPLMIVDSGAVVGRLNLNGVTRGALQGCSLGYWVSRSCNGRGLASAAVADAVSLAFGVMGLHRLEAATLLHNIGSQRVLRRNGFAPYGVTPAFLKIAGQWQDHVMFHLLNPAA